MHGTKYVTLEELLDDHPSETRATVERLGLQALGVYNHHHSCMGEEECERGGRGFVPNLIYVHTSFMYEDSRY